MQTRSIVLGVIVSLISFGAPAQVQDENSAPDHERHLHRHNPDHVTSSDRSRFYTSRDSAVTLPLPGEENAFSFVVYGDRTGGPNAGINILKDAVRDTNLLEPDFVITVGDMIQGYDQTGPWMKQMTEYKAVMDELICPWFPVAGNHDTYWRGENRPANEHDDHYEMHFGPLWYAFEHKNCAFIVLYTDEGNPETGEKNFRKPSCQEMSEEQLAWLEGMLEEMQDAEHVFLFVHHPRWLGGNYGDSWERVHEMLVSAGNVAGVFAGHIHRMRYDPRDGIEYVTLATVGGHQNKTIPDVGWLHHFNIVTVRPDQIAHAALPVGEVMDVREITGALADESLNLLENGVLTGDALTLSTQDGCEGRAQITLNNPTSHTVDFVVTPDSRDSRWSAWPDHTHGSLEPGESATLAFDARRPSGVDETFRDLAFAVDLEMFLPGRRYTLPTIQAPVPLELDLESTPIEETERMLALDGSSFASVPSDAFTLPDGPMTLECWFNAENYGNRTGLVAKTESSEYGFFVSRGVPSFSIHLDGSYADASAEDSKLKTDTWHHIAGVYDGSEVRLYVDGELVSTVERTGTRTTNTLPFLIGADVNGRGQATSYFQGAIDDVRLSSIARYAGDRFEPSRDWAPDADAVLLFDMDREVGPWVLDRSDSQAHARKANKAALK